MTLITETESLQSTFEGQKRGFIENPFPSYKLRRKSLKGLKNLLLQHQEELEQAMQADFSCRSASESCLIEIISSVNHINYSLKNLKSWMSPELRSAGLMFFPAKAEIHYQPRGVVGIISPWNYPLYLAIGPLIAALAAGNSALLKLSEFTPNTNRVIADMLSTLFSQEQVAVAAGGLEFSRAFSALAFDHLLFTGSSAAGKSVMRAAAENLVPVTLELGGKTPCILADDYSVKRFVSHFLLSKTANSGQSCVAPDMLYCPEDKVEAVIAEIQQGYRRNFPDQTAGRDVTSIITDDQWQRIQSLLLDAKSKGARVIPLQQINDSKRRQMALTLVLETTDDMAVEKQEIFGPLLVIKTFEDIHEVKTLLKTQERPLALYLFTNDSKLQSEFIYETHSGGLCVNDAGVHVLVDDIPFGGIGNSGMGSYHAEDGFKNLSHAKAVLVRGVINFTPLFGPPYHRKLHKLLNRWFLR